MDYFKELNESQRKAVCSTEGALLVIAGAGAGKTRTIMYRIFHLIQSGIAPSNILAVTFTNKAAEEMKSRIATMLGEKSTATTPVNTLESPFIGTFHSLGVTMLREKGHEIGIHKRFIIKDKEDSLRLIKEAMREKGIGQEELEPKHAQAFISKQKGELRTLKSLYGGESNSYFKELTASVWERYEEILKKERALDFDDLLGKPVELLRNCDAAREYYNKRFQFVHIDEYQDTNNAQYRLSRLLSGGHGNICAVGDADQNIYSWRGANMKNILRFEKDYPKAKVVFLEENYRSTKTILEVANMIIAKNQFRIPKNLFTNNTRGDKLSLLTAYGEKDEAYTIAKKAKEYIRNGVSAEDIAVLYRTNFQSRILEEAFLAHKVPYQVVGTRFFERKEIKDIFSYIFAALDSSRVSDVKRIINVPPRGIGKITIAKIFGGKRDELPHRMQEKVNIFYKLLETIKEKTQTLSPHELVKYIVEKIGLENYLKDGGEEGMDRLLNIRELVTLASRYAKDSGRGREEQLEAFLENAVLASDQDDLLKNKEGVRLMTVHASKGLEFTHVFISGLEQGLFPSLRKEEASTFSGVGSDGQSKQSEAQEEERRLFYVALTRAKKKVHLSFAETRMIYGSREINVPSEFLSDIPESFLEYEMLLDDGEPSIEYD